MIENWLQQQWQSKRFAHYLLLPLSWLFAALSFGRRLLYRFNILPSHRLAVPVIVVGNITVGGTGKTPLVIYLVEQLKAAGYTPGIISRGYGGKQIGLVTADSAPALMGDEPVLMARRAGVPVSVNPDRVAAGQALLNSYQNCNVIVSDDGLQHLRLQRDIEIVLVNKQALGNQCLLPAGPLREQVSRLQSVNMVVNSGEAPLLLKDDALSAYQMRVKGDIFHSLNEQQSHSAMFFKDRVVYAFAAIGHPERFFKSLTTLGLRFNTRTFPDHHPFKLEDFTDVQHETILMTEKDAVKCQSLPLHDAWYLPIQAELFAENLPPFHTAVIQSLKQLATKDR
ncbi:MAG: tetraacyldisaccharide 4'-kinase [Methylophilus sp.]|nr:tetraacyldisaccharide 4'-kinase [Methylophilus sp.]